jgi:hypothetical protein
LSKKRELFRQPGVLATPGVAESAQAIRRVEADDETVYVTLADESVQEFPATDITVSDNTARLEFVSGDTTYRVRELREDDGEWVSAYQMSLPKHAVAELITQGAPMASPDRTESLVAYALDDSVYVLGLVYTNPLGQWSREDGDWVLLAEGDDTFEGMIAMPISQQRSKDFIDFYDRNYIAVDDVDEYEDTAAPVSLDDQE